MILSAILAYNNSNIRVKTADNSISPDNVSTALDNVANHIGIPSEGSSSFTGDVSVAGNGHNVLIANLPDLTVRASLDTLKLSDEISYLHAEGGSGLAVVDLMSSETAKVIDGVPGPGYKASLLADQGTGNGSCGVTVDAVEGSTQMTSFNAARVAGGKGVLLLNNNGCDMTAQDGGGFSEVGAGLDSGAYSLKLMAMSYADFTTFGIYGSTSDHVLYYAAALHNFAGYMQVWNSSISYDDDVAAAAGGVPLYCLYNSGGVAKIRMA